MASESKPSWIQWLILLLIIAAVVRVYTTAPAQANVESIASDCRSTETIRQEEDEDHTRIAVIVCTVMVDIGGATDVAGTTTDTVRVGGGPE